MDLSHHRVVEKYIRRSPPQADEVGLVFISQPHFSWLFPLLPRVAVVVTATMKSGAGQHEPPIPYGITIVVRTISKAGILARGIRSVTSPSGDVQNHQ